MQDLKKAMAILLLLSGTLMTAQAGTTSTLSIGATIADKIELTASTTEINNWILDPDYNNGISTEAILQDHGLSVKTNKPVWTVNVQAEKAALTESTGGAYGTKVLAAMQLLASPVETGTTSAGLKTITTGSQLLWSAGAKKGNNLRSGLIFTQPVSYNDEPLASGSTYRNVLTFTLAASLAS